MYSFFKAFTIALQNHSTAVLQNEGRIHYHYSETKILRTESNNTGLGRTENMHKTSSLQIYRLKSSMDFSLHLVPSVSFFLELTILITLSLLKSQVTKLLNYTNLPTLLLAPFQLQISPQGIALPRHQYFVTHPHIAIVLSCLKGRILTCIRDVPS